MMESYRLSPLPQAYSVMKSRFFAYWQRKGFEEYRSPWVPVTPKNISHLKKGDLIIDETGFQKPFVTGREIVHLIDGKVTGTHQDQTAHSPVLAWVNTRSKADFVKFIRGNHFSDVYFTYSRIMGNTLQAARSRNIRLFEDVRPPLYHETNLEGAQNITANGIDYFTILSRSMREFGRALCTVSDQAERHGTLKGKMIELSVPSKGPRPKWLDRRGSIEIFNATLSLSEFITRNPANLDAGRSMRTSWGLYLWSTVCAEFSASALKEGNCVFIYDGFEDFASTIII